MVRYAVIVRELEDGKFLLRFPDFEGMTAMAEKDTDIEELAAKTLQDKVEEVAKNKVILPEPISAVDATKLLNRDLGEYTTFVLIDGAEELSWMEEGTKYTYKDLKKELKGVKDSVKDFWKNRK